MLSCGSGRRALLLFSYSSNRVYLHHLKYGLRNSPLETCMYKHMYYNRHVLIHAQACTINIGYNDVPPTKKKRSLYAKCHYIRSTHILALCKCGCSVLRMFYMCMFYMCMFYMRMFYMRMFYMRMFYMRMFYMRMFYMCDMMCHTCPCTCPCALCTVHCAVCWCATLACFAQAPALSLAFWAHFN